MHLLLAGLLGLLFDVFFLLLGFGFLGIVRSVEPLLKTVPLFLCGWRIVVVFVFPICGERRRNKNLYSIFKVEVLQEVIF